MGNVAVPFVGGLVVLVAVVSVFVLVDVVKAFFRRQETNEHMRRRRANSRRIYRKQATPLETVFEERDLEEVEDEEELYIEDYRSEDQECLAIAASDGVKVVGVCAFTNDLAVEYFAQELPQCCQSDVAQIRQHKNQVELTSQPQYMRDSAVESERPWHGRQRAQTAAIALRATMAAVSMWSSKWVYATEVNFLCQNPDVVRSVNTPGTRHHRTMKKFERRFEYNFFMQWTDNFTCEAAVQDLWESLNTCAVLLLLGEEDRAWQQFHLGHWHRTRVKPKEEHFHQEPHASARDNHRSRAKKDQFVVQDLVAV